MNQERYRIPGAPAPGSRIVNGQGVSVSKRNVVSFGRQSCARPAQEMTQKRLHVRIAKKRQRSKGDFHAIIVLLRKPTLERAAKS